MTKTPLPRSAACAAFEPLLPLAGHNLLDESDAAHLRAHLATCAACRDELALYDRVERAWRRAFEPRQEATPLVSQDAMLDILTSTPAHSSAPAASAGDSAGRPVLVEPRRRSHRFLGGLSALAAVVLIAAIVGAALLARAHPTRVAGGPAPSQPAYQNISISTFNDIAMVSPTEGWAVGGSSTAAYTISPTTITEQPLLWHYLNGVWSPVQLPIHGQLTSISMDSPTDGWAVGLNNNDQTQDRLLLLHYDGQTWKQISSNTFQGAILQPQQIQMLSPTDGWLVGMSFPYYSNPPQTMQGSGIWHYNGQTWQEQPMPVGLSEANQPGNLQVSSISMISPTEGWATVTWNHEIISATPTPTTAPVDLSPEGIILHYAAGRWTVQQTISHARLFSASMLSASDGWIGGQKATDALANPNASSGGIHETSAPLLLRYTQGRWVDATSSVSINPSSTFSLQSISMLSASDGWMVFIPPNLKNFTPTLLHYNGVHWSTTRLPTINNTSIYRLSRVVMTSPTDGWLVGSRDVRSSPGYTDLSVPLMFHFHQGTWSVVQS